MAYSRLAKRIILAFAIYFFNLPVFASAIFNDNAVNIWLVDTQTQAVTTYSFGAWVDSHQNLQSFPANAPFQVLVNGLAQSSQAMSPLQPSISIIGLKQADITSQSNVGPRTLMMQPESSSSNQTIEVVLQVDASAIEQGNTELRWQINNGAMNSVTLTPLAIADANGLVSKRFFLIADGSYNVVAQLYQAGQLVDEQTRTYTLASNATLQEKRDSDGDGLPDLVEDLLGLNPLSADAFIDSDNNGWSDLDEWLRCDELLPIDCSIPKDSDNDGWSDYDEEVRGTRIDDFELEATDSEQLGETFNKQKLAFQERPAARRLYEREYVLGASTAEFGISSALSLESAEFDGTSLYSLSQLVSKEDLATFNIDSTVLAPSLLLSSAQTQLEQNKWPQVRLPAGKALNIRATQGIENANNVDADSQQAISKTVSLITLNAAGDVDIRDFPSNTLGDWSTVEQWRTLFKAWLKEELVTTLDISFSTETTLASLLFEASLRQEASLAGIDSAISLGEQASPRNWLTALNNTMRERENATLYDWYARIAQSLSSQTSYANLVTQTTQFLNDLPVLGTNSSEWLNQRLAIPVVLAEQGCFITSTDLALIQADPDFFVQYQQKCPLYYTELELAAWKEQATRNRYLLRMTMFDQGAINIEGSASLSVYSNDTDGDNKTNNEEVLSQAYATSTYPWLVDSDGDDINDDIDECTLDPINVCAGKPTQPLLITGDDISVNVSGQGGIALLEIVLTHPAINPISFAYAIEANASAGDDAQDGVDFIAATNTITFVPGQQSVIIPVSLLNNELAGDRSFSVRFYDVEGASIQNDDSVQNVNVISAGQSAPTINLASQALSVNERAAVSFDASQSDSGINDPALSYIWQQVTGPSVVLNNANTAQADFIAPETLMSVNLEFTLQIENSDGVQTSAKVLVAVNPVDDPPVVIGMANYSVALGESVSINKADLLALIEEPDGETLTLSLPIQDIAGGSVFDSTDSIEFVSSGEGARTEVVLENNPLDLRSWQQDGLAYRTARTDLDPSEYTIHTWTAQEGSKIIDTSEQSYSGILSSPSQDILYYSRFNPDTSSTWIEWMMPDKTLFEYDTGGFGSLFGAQINPSDGSLYHCMDDVWQRLDPQNGTNTVLPLACQRFNAAQAQIDDKFCLVGAGGLHCTEDGTSFEQVFAFANEFDELYRVFSSEAGTIVMYHDYSVMFVVHVDGSPNGKVLYTLSDYFASVGGYWLADTFYTLLPINGDQFDQGAQLFKWQAGDSSLIGLGEPDLFAGDFTRFSHNEFIVFGENFLWMAQKEFDVYGKYLINSESGIFTQIDVDFIEQRNLANWQDNILQSSQRNEQGCDWFVLDKDGLLPQGAEPELDDADCYGQVVFGASLVKRSFNSETNATDFSVIPGGGGVSETQFTVIIQDENGNSVELTVFVTIDQGAG